MEDELEGVLENIDWSGMGRVINRTNVIELAPDSRYLFVGHVDESIEHERVMAAKDKLETILRSLMGEDFAFQVIIVAGDMSLDVYRFQEAIE